MSPAGDRRRRRRRRIIGVASAAAILATAITSVVINYWPGGGQSIEAGTAPFIRLDLQASRDMGALPSRDSWCSGSDHCWIFQQSSGDATDYGDVGGWHLTPTGSVRAGVLINLPIGAVDLDTELASYYDGITSTYHEKTGITGSATDLLSFTTIYNSKTNGTTGGLFIAYESGFANYAYAYIDTLGRLVVAANGTTTKSAIGPSSAGDSAWHCVTAVLSQSVGATKIWMDGAESAVSGDLDTGGTWFTGAGSSFRAASTGAPNTLHGGLARMKIKQMVAWTISDHRAHCSTLWQAPAGGLGDNKPLAVDDTWTQTGGAVCYPTGTSSAVCQPGGMPHYTVDATGLGFVTEEGLTNRVTYNTDIDCTNWTCTGSPTVSTAIAPDGSKTAINISDLSAANYINQSTSGYSNSVTVYPRFWIKCSGSGTIRVMNPHTGATGEWQITCSSVTDWTLIYNPAAQAGVSEIAAWTTNSSGYGSYWFRTNGATLDVTIWAPTLTEESGTGLAVIPTQASAVSTGDPVWAISNGLVNVGSQLLSDGDMEAADTSAWTAYNNATLTKETTDPYEGTRLLRVAYNGTADPRARQSVVSNNVIYRITGQARGDGSAYPKIYVGSTLAWTGTNSTSWQSYDETVVCSGTVVQYESKTAGAGYCEFDNATVYEQQSHGIYYKNGDTVTQTITPISGTCWDPLTSTGELLLSGLEGTYCNAIWYALEVKR